jgi:type I restriction enzyme S subunit
MSFPRYPKYKPSGVEWLGDVPEGWEAKPLKYSTLVYTGNSLNETEKKLFESTDPEALPYISSKDIDLETHEVQYENGLRIPKGQCGLKVAPSGSFLLCVEGGSAGRKVALLRHDVCFVNKLCCFSSRRNNKFRFYFSQSQNFKDKFGLSLTGLIGGVSTSLLKNFQIPTPSDPEQTAIAEFLDRETAKIDRLVAEQRRLMELLKEKRQAVISHAVTKGLNPHAPMKPSGNLWLGDVPAHWNVLRLKHVKANVKNAFVDGPFGSNLKSEHFIDGGDVYVIESGFATQGSLDTAELKTISLEHFRTIDRSEARAGDIIIAKIGAQFGKSSILPNLDKPAVVSGNSLKFTISKELCDVNFVHWHLVNLKVLGVIDDIVAGSAQPALSLGGMNNLPMLLPPRTEQEAIVQFVTIKVSEFDTLTAEAQRTIDLLEERRTALISAAVTGQIDVRQQPRN